jgi:hypothetical protein
MGLGDVMEIGDISLLSGSFSKVIYSSIAGQKPYKTDFLKEARYEGYNRSRDIYFLFTPSLRRVSNDNSAVE